MRFEARHKNNELMPNDEVPQALANLSATIEFI